jgi:hypothetical protein
MINVICFFIIAEYIILKASSVFLYHTAHMIFLDPVTIYISGGSILQSIFFNK